MVLAGLKPNTPGNMSSEFKTLVTEQLINPTYGAILYKLTVAEWSLDTHLIVMPKSVKKGPRDFHVGL